MWPADLIVASVKNQLERVHSDLCVFWAQVLGDRHGYAREVSLLSNNLITPIIVRGGVFDDPNSLSDDLVKVITENRDNFENAPMLDGRCVILLLARNEFGVPQMSSPAVLPEWFPVLGGQLVSASVSDLTWIAEAPLNGQESRIGDLCVGLFRLEGVMLAKMRHAHSGDHNAGNALFEMIRRGDGSAERYENLLESMLEHRKTVRTPTAFRPSVRQGLSLVGRLWQVSGTLSVEQVGRLGKALARALQLPEDIIFSESIVSVLYRPVTRDNSAASRFARNLVGLIQSTCQLVTAAAHADDYNSYPVALLRSLSYDLRKGLRDAEVALRNLESTTE